MKNPTVLLLLWRCFLEETLFEVHHAFWFNVISGFKKCHYKQSDYCYLLKFAVIRNPRVTLKRVLEEIEDYVDEI